MHTAFKVEVFKHESGKYSCKGESDGNPFTFEASDKDFMFAEVENQLDSALTEEGDV